MLLHLRSASFSRAALVPLLVPLLIRLVVVLLLMVLVMLRLLVLLALMLLVVVVRVLLLVVRILPLMMPLLAQETGGPLCHFLVKIYPEDLDLWLKRVWRNPHNRLIHFVRDPIEMIASGYLFHRRGA